MVVIYKGQYMVIEKNKTTDIKNADKNVSDPNLESMPVIQLLEEFKKLWRINDTLTTKLQIYKNKLALIQNINLDMRDTLEIGKKLELGFLPGDKFKEYQELIRETLYKANSRQSSNNVESDNKAKPSLNLDKLTRAQLIEKIIGLRTENDQLTFQIQMYQKLCTNLQEINSGLRSTLEIGNKMKLGLFAGSKWKEYQKLITETLSNLNKRIK